MLTDLANEALSGCWKTHAAASELDFVVVASFLSRRFLY
jgi:hypothetical protein